jgi:hypothetical protein
MNPYRESAAELIARKPGRLNILVSSLTSAPGVMGAVRTISDPQHWHNVYVRYGYTALGLGDDDNRTTSIRVPVMRDRFDETAINSIGQPGAFVVVPDVRGLEGAVAQLKSVWGDIPVQDNSGLVPHIADTADVLDI